jgi:hypothetical protein
MRLVGWFAALALPGAALAQTSPAPRAPVDQLIPWLLHEDQQLHGIPFSAVIFDTTERKVVPFQASDPADQRVAKAIGAASNETMRRMNALDSEIQHIDRINELSSHFEDTLRELLNATPGLQCDFPLTGDGKLQRSGYPDLRITDLESKRVFYLDPKLYAAGSRDSSFRTFYFEPKRSTNKVHDDGVHFIVGFEHAPRSEEASFGPADASESNRTVTQRHGYNAPWKFTRWVLVDLSRFTVKLKAEFQGSNHDVYRPEAIVASSEK